MGKFGISQPVTRREDDRLLTGRGRFTDDEHRAGEAYGFVVRGTHGHAECTRLDTTRAQGMPGVLAVLTAADLARDGISDIPCLVTPKSKPGTRYAPHGQPILARDRVRHVGEAIAFVVAESPAVAVAAAEAIETEYSPLPAVVTPDRAVRPDAPRIWDDAGQNICFEYELGDDGATEAAFQGAAHVVSIEVVNNRIVQNAMEPRAALAEWDEATAKFTLTVGTQMPHAMRRHLADGVLHVAPDRVRVLVHDVGGGFGGKNGVYPEYVLCLAAARRLERPVKWTGERTDAFVSDYHGRDNVSTGRMAFDHQGRILGFRIDTLASLGAYTAGRGTVSPVNGTVMASNTYVIPALHVHVRGVYCNTVPTDPYRGAGRPEITFLIERLMDKAALELGLDRVELRRRNLIRPDRFPYPSPTGLNYDFCDFAKVLDRALEASDWRGGGERRERAKRRGRLRGIGMANYVERCGGGGGLQEQARLMLDGDGGATLWIGTQSNGQGHETAYAQIVHHWLGLPFDDIRVVQGDTDEIATGGGTGGSWSIPMGGGAVAGAADRIIAKARRIAASHLESAEVDVEFGAGRFVVSGTDLTLSLGQVAAIAERGADLPDDLEPGLDESATFQPDNFTFPHGCHIAEVEIDPDTGTVDLVDYTVVHDFGRALNPLLLAGQVHGGLVQGVGQALTEHTAYGADGQLLAGSYMDYRLPRAGDVPNFRLFREETPTTRNPLGVKGCGEAGAAGAPPAIINALVDALRGAGCDVDHVDMPATPERVWSVLRGGRPD